MHAERGAVTPETAEALNAVKARGGRIVAVGTTSLRLLESAAGEDGETSPLRRRDQPLHHAGLSLSLRRSPLDQLPFAALNPVHAGCVLLGPRSHEACLCPCHRGAAIASIPTAMPACSARRAARHDGAFLLHGHGAGRKRAGGRHRDAARDGADARLHAGRHRRHGQGDVPRGRRCRGRRHRSRQHLSPDAAARRRAHRQARWPAPLHALGRSRSSPIPAAIRSCPWRSSVASARRASPSSPISMAPP